MRLTLLGTGDSGGTPRFGCACAACRTIVRTPSRAMLESDGVRVLIDVGDAPPAPPFAAILLTHFHLDHVGGLFPLRHGVGDPVPVYAPRDPDSLAYLFGEPGVLDFRHPDGPFEVAGCRITPIPLRHSVPSLGWLIRKDGASIAYLTDTKGLPAPSREILADAQPDLMVLDCTWPPDPNPDNHNDLNLALNEIDEIEPKRTVLTHLSHEIDLWRLETREDLPEGVEFAREGQAFTVV